MKRIFWVLLISIVLFSCIQEEENVNILAQVNQEKLTEIDLRSNFTELEWKQLTLEDKKDLVQDWIELTLLAQEADNLLISETPEIKNKISFAEKNIKSNALIAQKLSEISVSEDDLFNYYRVHKSQYQKSHVEYKVQRIYVKDEALLPEIRQEIKNSNFKVAAQKFSEESLGANGGYMGFVAEDDLNKRLWNTLKNLKRYNYQTVKVDDGFYIIRYYDVRNVKTEKTFVEVVDEIRTTLIRARKKEVFDDLIESLKKKSEISISI
ncbi:MAG: hypothetical protein B1H06_05580 [Candidatus Cloacimonas sp. 4484_143]|nr:MAG: hypothetical protein B1H06_05580 [Candidatus Cloacimonas sp. 4484_143]RLC50345.1 MAG: hypothetical protein DRI23_07255 [Candidatus Cloacimonadota bacterium]